MRPCPTPTLHRVAAWPAALLALLLVAALLVALVAPDTASATGRKGSHVPGDEPLPGQTIANPPLAPLVVDGEPTTVQQGVHQHAGYTVETPADWNGELVMWAHGFRGDGTVLTVDPPGYGLRRHLLEQGYAWAASSYARNGYDVGTGVTTTKGLADLASRRLLPGRTTRTYVAGVSMGGHVIGRSLEQYPWAYDGALPMCGVLGDQQLFDYFLGYNVVAQDLADRQVYPPPADYLTTDVPVIQQRLGLVGLTPLSDPTNELGSQVRDVTTQLSGGQRPGADAAFGVWKDFLFTLYTPDDGGSLALNPGRVADNRWVRYTPTQPVNVNGTVQRVSAPKRLRRSHRLTAVPRIEGRPWAPVLTLHGLGDLFVPFSMEQAYARDVARRHRSWLLVQRAIRSAGHCEFSEAEVTRAFDDLTTWVEAPWWHRWHARPQGDRVLDPAAVSRPSYGCRFTTGESYGPVSSTRGLYAPCP